MAVADRDIQIRGAAGHPDPGIRGAGGRIQKNFFSALWASVWTKNKGGPSSGSETAWLLKTERRQRLRHNTARYYTGEYIRRLVVNWRVALCFSKISPFNQNSNAFLVALYVVQQLKHRTNELIFMKRRCRKGKTNN